MSAFERNVNVGFEPDSAKLEVPGVMVLLKTGHSSIARDRALRRKGKNVTRVYCSEGSDSGAVGGCVKIELGDIEGRNLDGGGGLNVGGMWALNTGMSASRAVKSSVVEYL